MEELKPCPFCDTKDPATTESLIDNGRAEVYINPTDMTLNVLVDSEHDGDCKIKYCPKCGRPLNRRAEPEKKIVFKDGICPKCGGPTHGVNNGPMKCANCGYEQPPTYLIEFTEDEISEFRHYLNVVKNRQSLGSDIRLSVFKLLHKFPDAINTRKPENGKNP